MPPSNDPNGPINPSITIIGSLNIDFVTLTPRLPAAGETLNASSFTTGFGGKGANQAVACARLSGATSSSSSASGMATANAPSPIAIRMVGQLGSDAFGDSYAAALRKEGIDVSGIRRLEGVKTGVANILVEQATGENRILIVPMANGEFSESLDGGWDLVGSGESGEERKGGVVVMQLEIPLRVVLHNLHLARHAGAHTILNPAPAIALPASAYPAIDTLIMNETESAILAQNLSAAPDPTDPTPPHATLLALAKSFLALGVRDAVIITLGASGLVFATAAGHAGHVPACKADVVDTTAAGDTFVGGYAVKRARGRVAGSGGAAGADAGGFDYLGALRFASRAAARTVERAGAMDAIPRLGEVGEEGD